MANTATALTPIRVRMRAGQAKSLVTPVVVVFDTADSDLTVFTPAAERYAAVMGMRYAEASAHGLVWKSPSATTLLTEERAVNTVVDHRIGRPIVIGQAGSALIMRCTTAVIGSALLYIAEFNIIDLTSL